MFLLNSRIPDVFFTHCMRFIDDFFKDSEPFSTVPFNGKFQFFQKICLIFFATTFTVDTSLQGAGMSQIRSEMEFPDRVDIFQKKSHH